MQPSLVLRAVARACSPCAAVLLLAAAAFAACTTNPAYLYRTGYDKALSSKSWAARSPDQAAVIIGGYPSVW